MEYQKIKQKKFSKRSYKSSKDQNYWKKFKTIYENLDNSFMTSDISFCSPHNIFKENDHKEKNECKHS